MAITSSSIAGKQPMQPEVTPWVDPLHYTVAKRPYQGTQANKDTEGWVAKGDVFNVGLERTPGLRTISEKRAQELVRIGLHQQHQPELGPAPAKEANDPVIQRRIAKADLERQMDPLKAHAQRTAAQAPPRQTKVEPPPTTKRGATPAGKKTQEERPAAPRQVRRARTPLAEEDQLAAPISPTSTPGGETGAQPTSSSLSQEATPASASTGQQRGTRRTPAAKKPAG